MLVAPEELLSMHRDKNGGIGRGIGMWSRGPLRARSEKGASAVEFGLIVIPLLILITGVIQFALWFWAFEVGSHAAREGARTAAVDPCDEGAAEARAVDRVGSAGTGIAADAEPQNPGDVKVGDTVTVTVSFTPRSIAGLIPTLPDVSKSATARIENVPAGGC